jgi:hypothetical protein
LPYVAFVVFGSLFVRLSGSFWRELSRALPEEQREDHDHHHHQWTHASRAAAERAVPVGRRRPARAAEVDAVDAETDGGGVAASEDAQFRFNTNINGL